MKKLFLLFVLLQYGVFAQSKYEYKTFINDPLKVKEYTLKNGLKVFLSVNKNAPRIQTYIAVNAGSKNDPADATGLAHYLEHMVFKGSDVFGTKDFTKEQVLIQRIENLYEEYRKTTQADARKKIYRQIDSISGIAARYAIANEYDKMVASIGTLDNNAYTSNEQTVYQSDIPSNQIENWLKIEGERFRKPILRLFHTELEAVYEEKNRTLDDDGSRAFDSLMTGLFKKHNYGLQTTIGTVDHLKNPSMRKIREYYDAYYVPNNMAIIISGDLDPDKTIALIEKYFSYMQTREVKPYTFSPEDAIIKPVVKEVIGPKAENVLIGYRLPGYSSQEAATLPLLARILFNQKAGLMDLNLYLPQKVQSCGAFEYRQKDYSVFVLTGEPQGGQSTEEVMKLLLGEVEKLKKGEFDEWLVEACKNKLRKELLESFQTNQGRASAMTDVFGYGMPWQDYLNQLEYIKTLSKKDIVAFANKFFLNNYVAVLKKNGVEKSIVKVDKPMLTPVEVNRNDQSEFLKSILMSKPEPVSPRFIDLNKDYAKTNIAPGLDVISQTNTDNELFEIHYVFEEGRNNDSVLPIAIKFLEFMGNSKMTAAQVQQEMFKLGGEYFEEVTEERTAFILKGLQPNMKAMVELFESLLNDGKIDDESFSMVKESILKEREDMRKNKDVILRQAMYNYALYGKENPFTFEITNEELKRLKAETILNELKELKNFSHQVFYYGPLTSDKIKSELGTVLHSGKEIKPFHRPHPFKEIPTEKVVYVVDYDMQQAEIMFVSRRGIFDPTLVPVITLYNEYFSGGMSGLVFQELRESRALAYSCNSRINIPKYNNKSFMLSSYIGSQVDKLPEAMSGMRDLLDNMPYAEVGFLSAKESLISKLRTERLIGGKAMLFYEDAQRLGLKSDIRSQIFEKLPTLAFSDVKAFQEKHIKNAPSAVLVLGNKKNLDIKTLEKYGKVVYLQLDDIFGK